MRALLIFALLLFLSACGDDDRRPGDSGISRDATSDAPLPDASTTDASSPDASAPDGLSVVFDYRFDRAGFFADPARRATLEAAAAAWGSILRDEFEDIPVGTSIRSRDPEAPAAEAMNFVSDEAIDDVLVFVGCASFSDGIAQSNHAATTAAIADTALAARLQARYEGDDFEPWTGWIAFRCDVPWFFDATPETVDDIPAEDNDFYSTAMHEIGHVLGFGTATAYFALVDEATFIGPEAVAAFGGPVPLTASGVHFQSSVLSDGTVTLMDISRTIGTRTPPTTLDRAVMADLGYELAR